MHADKNKFRYFSSRNKVILDFVAIARKDNSLRDVKIEILLIDEISIAIFYR